MRIRECHGGACRVDMGVVQKYITLNGKAMSGTPVDAGTAVKGPLDRAGKTLQKKSPGSAGRVALRVEDLVVE